MAFRGWGLDFVAHHPHLCYIGSSAGEEPMPASHVNIRQVCTIIPPYISREISQRGTPEQRAHALRDLSISERVRGRREVLGELRFATPAGTKRRTIYDAKNTYDLPGLLVRGEGDPASRDTAVNEAYRGSGATYDFF